MDPPYPLPSRPEGLQSQGWLQSTSAAWQRHSITVTHGIARRPALAAAPPPTFDASQIAASLEANIPVVLNEEALKREFREHLKKKIVAGKVNRELLTDRSYVNEELRRWKVSRERLGRPLEYSQGVKRKASETALASDRRPLPLTQTGGTSRPSLSNVIDLTSSPPRHSSMTTTQPSSQRQTLPPHRHPSSRSSPVTLPTWQPDANATQCSACSSEFTIWKRKHHCRKCGKVVCDACSRHRITIPRRYIVQPPEAASSSALSYFTSPPLQASTDSTGSRDVRDAARLGGSEVVRVCNPCVPDPNFSPPPQTPQEQPSPQSVPVQHPSQRASLRPPLGPPHSISPNTLAEHQAVPRWPNASAASANINRPPRTYAEYQAQSHQRRATLASSSASPQGIRPYQASQSPFHPPLDFHSATRHRNSTSHRRPPSASPSTSSHSIPHPRPHLPQPPRREIPEEDECPVCGRELPPKGPNDDETARTRHVEQCIALYSSSAASSSLLPPPPPPPARQLTASGTTPAQAATISASAPSSSHAIPPRSSSIPGPTAYPTPQQRQRRHRIIHYTATEKDCLTTSGETQECVICMEDFGVGDEMGRLDCFCKFHRGCILGWWERSGESGGGGRGGCPTHQIMV